MDDKEPASALPPDRWGHRLSDLPPAAPEEIGGEFRLVPRTAPRHGGSILMAAMIGLANAMGLDPEPTEMVQPADVGNGPEFDLSFGDLPPLN